MGKSSKYDRMYLRVGPTNDPLVQLTIEVDKDDELVEVVQAFRDSAERLGHMTSLTVVGKSGKVGKI